jgi:Cd2+/Zn2+-exporting ATPase
VELLLDGAADGMWALSHMNKVDADEVIDHQKATVRWPIVLSGIFWLVSMLSFIGGNWEYLKYVALLSVAFGLPAIAQKAYRTLRNCRFDANAMMLFAALGAVALQEYTEAAAVTFLFAISESLETRATARARNALAAIVCLRPERANVINPITKEIVVLSSNAVAVGTLVSVSTGDMIPCDGIVVEGKSTVDESSLTGESRPVHKGIGSNVAGGTLNSGSTRLVVKTTSTSNNSAIARLIRLVEEAQVNRSETEKLVDAFAKVYTPIVLLTAVCMCTIPWAFGPDVGRFWTHNGLVAIVIACPCALIISTPVTYVAGLAAAAQKGVIVKGGACMEAMAGVKRIAFDKTGTLSEGIFQLLHFNLVGTTRSRKEVLEYLALMEAPASHPLSDAIVKGAANEQVGTPAHLEVKDHTILPGEGIMGLVQGKQVHVGNQKLFERLNLLARLPKGDADIVGEWTNAGGSVGFISIDGEGIIGAYCVADRIRIEAASVVRSLQKMGISITMLTGDQRRAALGIGHQIGLRDEDIKSQLLPEDKLAYISNEVEVNVSEKKCWTRKRKVMMVGDGVNDAPALALADISVAMGEGAALAMETSDVTLMDSNLNKLLFIIRMGRRVTRTIIENVVFSLATKAVVMGFAFAGRAGLWAAIATDVGSMLVVTLNGMKLLPSSRKVRQNELRSRTGEGFSDSRGSSTSGRPSQPLLEVSNDDDSTDTIDDNFVEEDQPCC